MTPQTAAADDYRRIFFEMNGESSRTSNYRLWSKYTIYGVNIIFMLVGTLVLATGAWLRTDSRFRDFLSERYRQAVHEAFWEAPTLYAFSYIMILLGLALLLMAMFGCCGVTNGPAVATTTMTKRRRRRGHGQQNGDIIMTTTTRAAEDVGGVNTSPPLLWLYTVGTVMLLMFTLGCGSYILYTKDGIDVELSDALNYMVQHYYQGPGIVQESLDRLQQAFRCCGNAGCSDFLAFRQDPPRTCDLRCDGCHYRIWLALRIGFSVALAIFGVVILAQIVAISVSLILLCITDEDDDYEFDDSDEYGSWTTAAIHRPNNHHHSYHHNSNANGRHWSGGGVRSLGHAVTKTPHYLSSSSFDGHCPGLGADMYAAGGANGTFPSRKQWHQHRHNCAGMMPRQQQRQWPGQQRHHFLPNAGPPASFHYY